MGSVHQVWLGHVGFCGCFLPLAFSRGGRPGSRHRLLYRGWLFGGYCQDLEAPRTGAAGRAGAWPVSCGWIPAAV